MAFPILMWRFSPTAVACSSQTIKQLGGKFLEGPKPTCSWIRQFWPEMPLVPQKFPLSYILSLPPAMPGVSLRCLHIHTRFRRLTIEDSTDGPTNAHDALQIGPLSQWYPPNPLKFRKNAGRIFPLKKGANFSKERWYKAQTRIIAFSELSYRSLKLSNFIYYNQKMMKISVVFHTRCLFLVCY